jgi:hypothetical protein
MGLQEVGTQGVASLSVFWRNITVSLPILRDLSREMDSFTWARPINPHPNVKLGIISWRQEGDALIA